MASNVNPDLVEFFMNHHTPGAIGLVGSSKGIYYAVRVAQKSLTKDGKVAKYNHCFLLDDLRWSHHGAGGAMAKAQYILESDYYIHPEHYQIRCGAQENWIAKWCDTSIEHAAVVNFGLNAAQRKEVLATALQLVDEQVKYTVAELIGTWLAIITLQLWKPNPFDAPHAMYCSSYARYCYRKAGRDFMGSSVSISNTAPEHIAQAAIAAGCLTVFS